MKKIFFLLFVAACCAFVSCKSNKAKDLIVNKWKITDINIPEMPVNDSIKTAAMKGTMEFTKDKKWQITGMGKDMIGTYSLTDDGKTLFILVDDKSETHEVVELTSTKLVLIDKSNKSKLTLAPR
jgi:hypothetical protein